MGAVSLANTLHARIYTTSLVNETCFHSLMMHFLDEIGTEIQGVKTVHVQHITVFASMLLNKTFYHFLNKEIDLDLRMRKGTFLTL